MPYTILKFRSWTFQVDRESTIETYAQVIGSGADTCLCCNCKNYVAFRNDVFPYEIKKLFEGLGIDYRKEVEIISFSKLENGLYHIGGWFHFQGRLLNGKNCKTPFNDKGFTLDLTPITNDFSIGFFEGNDLAFFKNKDELVQIEFTANIPWVIGKKLEPE